MARKTNMKGIKALKKAVSNKKLSNEPTEFMAHLRARLQDQGLQTVDELKQSISCIPFPNLPMQWLFGFNGLPLSRLMSIFGPEGTGKSSLAYWFVRMFLEFGGLAFKIESERKENVYMLDQLLGPYKNLLVSRKPDSLEHALNLLHQWGATYKEAADDLKKKGQNPPPLLIVWDSLATALSEAVMSAVLEEKEQEGYIHARTAAKINNALCTFVTQYLDHYPIFLILINHERRRIDSQRPSYMPPEMYEPGGSVKDYLYSFRLHVSRGTPVKWVTGSWPTSVLKLAKNCMDVIRSGALPVTKYTSKDPETGEVTTWFDWDSCFVHMWLNLVPKEANKKFPIKKDGNVYKCEPLNVTLPADELGNLIHNTPEAVKAIQEALDVKIFPVYSFDSGTAGAAENEGNDESAGGAAESKEDSDKSQQEAGETPADSNA